jgi:hypothetical protein
MKPIVFIHTNKTQLLGAKVAAYALKRASAHPEEFEVQTIELENYSHLTSYDGQPFVRDGEEVVWHYAEMQSFTLLRFLPPQLMNYQGRSIVIDPDIFAIGDVWELLSRDMQGKAVMCRKKGDDWATSCMLMDNAKLTDWKWEQQVDEMFSRKRDYQKWVNLELEPAESVGLLEDVWNDFDHLDEHTKFVHNTRRITQPWRTGLPFQDLHQTAASREKKQKSLKYKVRALLGKQKDTHRPHPDKRQQDFFFGLVSECLEKGIVSKELLQDEITEGRLRADAFDVISSTPPLERTLASLK